MWFAETLSNYSFISKAINMYIRDFFWLLMSKHSFYIVTLGILKVKSSRTQFYGLKIPIKLLKTKNRL